MTPIRPFILAFPYFEKLMTELGSTSSIHLSQEIVLLRDERPQESAEVEIVGARLEPKGVRLALRTVLGGTDPYAHLMTGVLLPGATMPESFGSMPSPAAPGGESTGPETVVTRVISLEDIRRYSEVSGDRNPVHLDDDAARAAGFPGIIAHGMNVLAIACEEAGTVRNVGGRFSTPVLPGEPIEITLQPHGRVIRFSCKTSQGFAIKNGWMELGDD